PELSHRVCPPRIALDYTAGSLAGRVSPWMVRFAITMSRTPPGWPRALRGALARVLGSGDAPRPPAAGQNVRASEERLRSALRSGRAVAWEWDLLTDRVIRSENSVELLGLPVQSNAREGGEFMKVVHPDDRERVGRAVRRAMETGEPVE